MEKDDRFKDADDHQWISPSSNDKSGPTITHWKDYVLNPAVISALAALGGSALGALTPLTSTYLMQEGQAEREAFNLERAEKQALYGDFIQLGAKLYARSITSSLDKVDDVVALYALISRMRLLTSQPVVDASEEFALLVVKRYGEPNQTLEDFRSATLLSHADPLHDFSTRCREELRNMSRQVRNCDSRWSERLGQAARWSRLRRKPVPHKETD